MRRRAALVAVAAACGLTLAGCGPGLQSFSVGRSVSGPSYHVTAVFADASGLPIGGSVQLHNVTIGRVESMTTHDFKAYVRLVLQKSVRLPLGTTARMALTTPLGEEYIQLQPPSGTPTGYLGDGDQIAADRTSRAADVEDLLSAFSSVLNGGGISQLHDIIGELNRAFTGHITSGRAALAQLNDVVRQLAQHTDQIDAALSSLSRLSGELAGQRDVIARGLTSLAPGVEALHADTAGFTKLLTHLSRVGRTTTSVLDQVQGELVADLRGLAPTLDTLLSLRHRLTPTLAGLLKFARLLDRAVPGDYINLNGAFQEAR